MTASDLNGGQLELLEKEKVYEDDHDVFAHYVERDQATEAYVFGIPVVALCGKIWVPHRNPDKYPICPECEECLKELTGG